jgi:2'-5' RNA ligase
MNKYIIVSFLEDVSSGMKFQKSEWPLHLTIIPPFFFNKEEKQLINLLNSSFTNKKPITLIGESKEMFGPEREVEVTVLKNTEAIQELHNDIQERLRNWIIFKSKQYPDYRPHVSGQGEKEINVGKKIIINNVSLVKSYDNYWKIKTKKDLCQV